MSGIFSRSRLDRPAGRALAFVLVAAPVLALDQVTKLAAPVVTLDTSVPDAAVTHAIANAGGQPLLGVVTLAFIALFFGALAIGARFSSPLVLMGAGLAVGGAAGNAVDRIARGGLCEWIDAAGSKTNLGELIALAGMALFFVGLVLRNRRR